MAATAAYGRHRRVPPRTAAYRRHRRILATPFIFGSKNKKLVFKK